jgi:hypothetical protein
LGIDHGNPDEVEGRNHQERCILLCIAGERAMNHFRVTRFDAKGQLANANHDFQDYELPEHPGVSH